MTQTLQAPGVLLMGGTGSGKTYSLPSLIEAGCELFVIVTEPTGLDSLLDSMEQRKLPIDKLHYKQIMPARAGFQQLIDLGKKVGLMDYKSLSETRPTAGRDKASFHLVLETLANFKCDRTGESYGAVDAFSPDRALAIDSLSGLSLMAMDMVIGDKVSAHQGEWGVAMNMLEKLLLALSSGLRCPFVLTSHLERETNEVTGSQIITASTLGRKLAPKLPRFFSEVVMAYREGKDFKWSTIAPMTDLKQRALPLSDKLEPSFKPVIEAYQRRLKFASGNAQNATTATGK